nr:substrate binding domain-containing protein [Pseudoruegeria sp. HB172150]
MSDTGPELRGLRGTLRVRTPNTIGSMFIGKAVTRFQAANPDMRIELHLIDRPVNPLEEGFDVSLGALPQSYWGVHETPIQPYPRVLVAAPGYMKVRPPPATPSDLVAHDCLAFMLVGHTWTFEGPSGPVSTEIRARYTVNDSGILLDAALQGLGLAVLPRFLARDPLRDGRLVELLPDFPVSALWLKALVPSHKSRRPEIIAFLDHIQKEFDPPPWDR